MDLAERLRELQAAYDAGLLPPELFELERAEELQRWRRSGSQTASEHPPGKIICVLGSVAMCCVRHQIIVSTNRDRDTAAQVSATTILQCNISQNVALHSSTASQRATQQVRYVRDGEAEPSSEQLVTPGDQPSVHDLSSARGEVDSGSSNRQFKKQKSLFDYSFSTTIHTSRGEFTVTQALPRGVPASAKPVITRCDYCGAEFSLSQAHREHTKMHERRMQKLKVSGD